MIRTKLPDPANCATGAVSSENGHGTLAVASPGSRMAASGTSMPMPTPSNTAASTPSATTSG
jgi:hypothetical protein